MSKVLPISVALVLSTIALLPVACSKHDDAEKKVKTQKSTNPLEVLSYAQGFQLGAQLPTEINTKQLAKGIEDGKSHKDPIYTEEEIKTAFTAYQKTIEQKAKALTEKNESFLATNGKKSDIKTTASGLQYKIIKEGTGKVATPTSTVKVNYEGKLVDNTVFDSTFARKEPAELPLGSTIPGWIEGLPLIKEGGSIMLYVPAKLGYGERDVGNIPANSVLIFKVELLEVK